MARTQEKTLMRKIHRTQKKKDQMLKEAQIKKRESQQQQQDPSDHDVEPPNKKQHMDDNNEEKVFYPPQVDEIREEDEARIKALSAIPESVLSDVSFSDVKGQVSPQTLKAIDEMGFTKMTEIQAKSIPHVLQGRDLVASAKTGSGKTLAFLVPAIELMIKLRFMPRNGTGVIIISPTRELSMQTFGVLKELMAHHNQTFGLIMGGANRHVEAEKLVKGINILVATPGRLLDHLQNTKNFLFKNLQCLIIDEADRILDIGFEEEMKQIIRIIPKRRQTMLFSATLTAKTNDLINMALKTEPLYVGLDEVREKATVEGLEQGYVIAPSDKRFLLLFTFLKKNRKKKVMVFFSSCMSVKFHQELLNYIDLPVMSIHGKQKQTKRTTTFFQFCSAESGILLCTDVAARGLDIPQVDWIVQYDPPDDPTEYIHRVGRTARGEGGQGHALLILRPEELGFLHYLKEAKVPLQEFDFSWNRVLNVQDQLERLISKNYFLNLSAKEAYKAYVRAYDSHSLKHIFDINTLDLVTVAKSFGFSAPPFVDLPLSAKKKLKDNPSAAGVAEGKKLAIGGQPISRGPKSYRNANLTPLGQNDKKTRKSIIYRAVPLHKKQETRQFTR